MRYLASVLGTAVVSMLVTLFVLAFLARGALASIEWANPWAFSLLFFLFAAVFVRGFFFSRPAALRHSRPRSMARVSSGFAGFVADAPDGIRLAAGILIVLALARPQSTELNDKIKHEGIDIAVAIDLSESMAADDIRPSRIEAAKGVVEWFVKRREHDRIALVAFGLGASTVAPLTTDHDVLLKQVRKLRLGVMDGSKTAIGAGIGLCLNRLAEPGDELDPAQERTEESEAERAGTRIIVLLTDGVQTAPGMSPDTAAAKAAKRNVKVYTILMGRKAGPGGRSIDPKQLQSIAQQTGGRAYRAQDVEELKTSFQEILDELETSTVESSKVQAELFMWFLAPILLLLGIDVVLRNTRLRRFP